MKIDRDRFLLIAAAIAAQSCGRAAATIAVDPILPPVASAVVDPEGPITAPLPPPQPGAVTSSTPIVASAAPVDATACEKENDTGTVDCSKFRGRRSGPACEGLEGTCDLLAKGAAYRPRAAAAAAACLTRIGAGACDIRARNRCYLEGVKASCAEPQYESRCQAKIDMCRAANVRVQYTKEECMKAMSSQHERDREWAISQMGPSSEGKCQLMYTVF